MAVVLHVGPDDWQLVRFAVSPLHETTAALRLVRRVLDGHLVPNRPWELAAVRRAAQLPLEPLLALLPAGSWNPDVLNPPPLGPRMGSADELAQVAAVDPDTFAGELARCVVAQGRAVPPAAPAAQRDEVVGLLELAWRELLAPEWPRLQDVLSADIALRGSALAAGGLAAVLADLHPQVQLVGSTILVGIAHAADLTLDGRGLTLLPTAWGGGVGAMWDPPWQPASLTPPAAPAPPGPPSPTVWGGSSDAPGPSCSPRWPPRPPPAVSHCVAGSRSVPPATTSPRYAMPALPPPTGPATPCSTAAPTSATHSCLPQSDVRRSRADTGQRSPHGTGSRTSMPRK